jgi:hypothetical protein
MLSDITPFSIAVMPHFIIPLEPDYDVSKIEHVKHSHTTLDAKGTAEEKTIIEIAKLSDSYTPYEFLVFYREFNNARPILDWTTGLKLFTKFPIHLTGHAADTWCELTEEEPTTVNSFDSCLNIF